jgi:hypothetical protein
MKLGLAIGLTALALGAGAARAQLPPPTPAQTAAEKGPARDAQGRSWISGVWVAQQDPSGSVGGAADYIYSREAVMGTAEGFPLPIKPALAPLVDKRLKDAAAGHPYASTQARCLPPGVPDMMYEFGPMQYLETPGQITILRQEFWFFRLIKMGGKHAADPDPSFMGDSIGHWEGNTLVVDTVGLTEKTGIRFIIPHSEKLHITERFSLTPEGLMQDRLFVDDPEVFTKPWSMVQTYKRLDNPLQEYICENNRNGVDAEGNETSVMPGAGVKVSH